MAESGRPEEEGREGKVRGKGRGREREREGERKGGREGERKGGTEGRGDGDEGEQELLCHDKDWISVSP